MTAVLSITSKNEFLLDLVCAVALMHADSYSLKSGWGPLSEVEI
jgi:hypothetical protein